MKNFILLTSFLLSSVGLFSQDFDDAILAKASTQTCNCLTEKEVSETDIDAYFNEMGSCIQGVIMSEDVLMVLFEYLDEDSDIDVESQAEVIGERFGFAVMRKMVHVCDLTYNIFEDTKKVNAEYSKEVFETPESIARLDTLLDYIALSSNPDAVWYLESALIYHAKDDLEKAEEFFTKSNDLQVITNLQQLILFTYVLELNGKYDKALEIYDNALKNGADMYLMITAETTVRKKNKAIPTKD